MEITTGHIEANVLFKSINFSFKDFLFFFLLLSFVVVVYLDSLAGSVCHCSLARQF